MNLSPASRLVLAAAGAASLVGFAGVCAAHAQNAPAPQPPPPAAPPVAPDDGAQSFSSSSSMWSITTEQDGRRIKIASANGALTAEVDGKPVPADRISRSGDLVTIKDDKGNVIAEQTVPSADTSTRMYSYSGRAPAAAAPRALRGHTFTLGGPRDNILHVQADPPKVMIGVQLVEPDSSIRGHLGLKEGESTMVSAVYEGLPAALAGLEPYDVITSVNGKTPADPITVRQALRDTEAGKSISLDVIHRGQKKAVSISPEKYDPEKLDKAKINQIAAASSAPAAAIAGVGPDDQNNPFGQVWKFRSNGSQPLVGTIPGQPGGITLWTNPSGVPAPGVPGVPDMEAMHKQLQELMEQMQRQSQQMREQADRMHELQGPGPNGMDERMKRIEDYMRRMMERDTKNGDKPQGRS